MCVRWGRQGRPPARGAAARAGWRGAVELALSIASISFMWCDASTERRGNQGAQRAQHSQQPTLLRSCVCLKSSRPSLRARSQIERWPPLNRARKSSHAQQPCCSAAASRCSLKTETACALSSQAMATSSGAAQPRRVATHTARCALCSRPVDPAAAPAAHARCWRGLPTHAQPTHTHLAPRHTHTRTAPATVPPPPAAKAAAAPRPTLPDPKQISKKVRAARSGRAAGRGNLTSRARRGGICART